MGRTCPDSAKSGPHIWAHVARKRPTLGELDKLGPISAQLSPNSAKFERFQPTLAVNACAMCVPALGQKLWRTPDQNFGSRAGPSVKCFCRCVWHSLSLGFGATFGRVRPMLAQIGLGPGADMWSFCSGGAGGGEGGGGTRIRHAAQGRWRSGSSQRAAQRRCGWEQLGGQLWGVSSSRRRQVGVGTEVPGGCQIVGRSWPSQAWGPHQHRCHRHHSPPRSLLLGPRVDDLCPSASNLVKDSRAAMLRPAGTYLQCMQCFVVDTR